MQPPLVVGLGRIGLAISALGPHLPSPRATAELASLAITPGPGVAVALRAASQLGCRARAAGRYGADGVGQLARASLREAGIDVELLRAHGASACEIVMIASDGTLRARANGGVRADPAPMPAPAPATDVAQAMVGASALLIDGSLPDEQLAAARHARAARLPVILDLGEVGDQTHALIAAADVLIASERAAGELAPRDDLGDAVGELLALGPRAAVITLGAAGAIGRHGSQVVRCPAFPSDALDSSGAGSVFHGGFAAALLSGLPFARCIELAAAAAALSLTELGPWHSMPSRDAVLALAKTRRAV